MRTTLATAVFYYSPWPWKRLLLVAIMALFMIFLLSMCTVQADGDASEYHGCGGNSGGLQWHLLTKSNFSSQIRQHPHILLMVTVPWSGESRSLMKELAVRIANEQEKYCGLKLMLLYRNSEKMLADAIGDTDGITIIFYHHSLSYKYQGRLRTQNILSSVQYLMPVPSEQLPIKSLNTREDLKTFLESTDKALLLLEFCGWTQSLMARGKMNGTANDFDGPLRAGFTGETNGSHAAQSKKNQALNNEKMTCDVQHGFGGIPWLGEFSSVSESDLNESIIDGIACSFEKFQQFDSFFTKLMNVAREFFLPPEKLQFGLLTERSLLSMLGDEDSVSWLSSLHLVDSDSWLVTLSFAGCPTCSMIIREGDDLKSALQMQNPLVTELGDGGHDSEPTLPANKPSLLLFIDRSSDLVETRTRSKEALDAFRSLALQYYVLNEVSIKTESLLETYQRSKIFSGHQNNKLSSASQNVALKDKISIMVVNEGKHVILDKIASGLQGHSLHEILAYVLQRENEVKLSSLAKEVGFQLLSEDFNVKVQEALPMQEKILESDQVLTKPAEVLPEASVDLHKDKISYVGGISSVENDDQNKISYSDESSKCTEEKTTFDTSRQPSGEPVHLLGNQVLGSADNEAEQKTFPRIINLDQKLHSKGFAGSFFLCDDGYHLLRALTAGSNIPSVIIIDPVLQKHYVFPEGTDFSYSSLSDFVNGFLSGSLIPYQQSASGVQSPREAPSPPFVNLDFHEANSIPQVTTHTFSELVIGVNQSDNPAPGHVWKKDVVVLFSNSWCGFCQRMELVVREAYRVFKHHATMLKVDKDKSFLTDAFQDVKLRLPQFYFMDCTLNECSLILKSVAQRELYPSLLLFPAESKNAVSYDGDVAVSNVIKFVITHGNNALDLFEETDLEKRKPSLHEDASHIPAHEEAPSRKDKHHEVLFKYRIPERVLGYNKIRPRNSNALHGGAPQVVVGSLLIASEKLLNVHPFDNSIVLIVKSDQGTGFQGLIINKHISWDSLEELEDGLKLLRDARLSFGGPLLKRGMPLVALTQRTTSNQYLEVLANVHFLDQQATVHEIEGLKLSNHSATDYWFFLGYSRWGWEQLFDEINQGAWNVSSVDYEELDWPWR